ncbi:hypothetical protein C8Q72DRAFT_787925 [Fomitopsis betulina]|nr:hypothetical protein C8Q72DRAFT_787925 [Fomitopsis betulina]
MLPFAARCLLAGALTLFFVSGGALANTEIVNFAAADSADLSPALLTLTANWTALSARAPERLLRIQPARLGTPLADVCHGSSGGSAGSCPHEHWLTLRLDDPTWSTYSRFTFRLSWPASSPADFDVEVKSAEALSSKLPEDTQGCDISVRKRSRRMYARVRVVDAGVRTPIADGSHEHATPEPVPVILILEPLYLGVLPTSVLPTVAFVGVVILITACWVVPLVQKIMCAVADKVGKEFAARHVKLE